MPRLVLTGGTNIQHLDIALCNGFFKFSNRKIGLLCGVVASG